MTSQIHDTKPIEINEVEPELQAELMKCLKMLDLGFVRVGPKGYMFPDKYKEVAFKLFNLPLQESDVCVMGFPRSGTNWTQELVWLIVNDLDYETAGSIDMWLRYKQVDFFYIRLQPEVKDALNTTYQSPTSQKILASSSTAASNDGQPTIEGTKRKFLKFHMPISLLPPKLLDTAKVVYVARDPRDVVVSYYYFFKHFRPFQFCGDLKQLWNLFINDHVTWAPYFEHVKEAWEMRHHSNMLFLFYEDVLKDLGGTVRRVAQFFGKSYTEEQLQQLCEHLSFDNIKNNPRVNGQSLIEIGVMMPDEEARIARKGVSGGWRQHFDAEMRAQAEQWIASNLRGTDLRFPSMADEHFVD